MILASGCGLSILSFDPILNRSSNPKRSWRMEHGFRCEFPVFLDIVVGFFDYRVKFFSLTWLSINDISGFDYTLPQVPFYMMSKMI